MDRLARTRSQHFVHSPRKVGSPLKLRHNSTVNRHPIKRRRLVSNVHPLGRHNGSEDLTTSPDPENGDEEAGPSSLNRPRIPIPLSSEVGAQTVNRNGRKSGNVFTMNGFGGAPTKKDAKGKAKASLFPAQPPQEAIIFSSEDGSSPRKRKRTHSGDETEGDSSSWIEMDEDEAEPEFIAEGESMSARLPQSRSMLTVV